MGKIDHVLVVGAGVAGLTAAICLDTAGIRATVHEAQPEGSEAGASFVIRGSGWQVLAGMGLLEEVERRSLPMPHRFFSLGGPTGKDVIYDNEALGEGSVLDARAIDRSTFMAILLTEARRRGIEIHYGRRLHRLDQHPESVTATFTDGSRADGDLLIGADGRGSITRSCIFPHTRLRHARGWNVYGRAHTGDLDPVLAAELHTGATFMHFIGDMSFLAYRDDPQSAERFTWLLSGRTTRKIPAKSFELLDRGVLVKELDEGLRPHSWAAADVVAASTRLAPTQVFHLPPLPAWSQGRVALIGDAVHAADPMTGTGTSLALEDGMYVAKMLREHHYMDAFHYLHADRHEAAEKINASLDPDRVEFDAELEAVASYRFDVDWDQADERPVSTLLSTHAP
ncbi:NAD(P)/FAD-dependent oxidoreductase [Streptomyces sp. NPDC048430]|uniref:FAD-dependent oxidoreductase n=1 Tax=Streptomyces sp. NPDC048430 TaxID=3155388 RepID=UPI003426C389